MVDDEKIDIKFNLLQDRMAFPFPCTLPYDNSDDTGILG